MQSSNQSSNQGGFALFSGLLVVSQGLDEFSLVHRGSAINPELCGPRAEFCNRPLPIASGCPTFPSHLSAGGSGGGIGYAGSFFLNGTVIAELLIQFTVFHRGSARCLLWVFILCHTL